MKQSVISKVLAVFLAISLAAPAWAQSLVDLPAPTGSNFFSPDQDVQLGKQNAEEVRKQMPILPDSNPVSQYVQQLGKRLEATMPQPNWPYEFHVVQQKDINAFALPGGPIFVNLGTIIAADNEAQLAGVIAHEMSHVYERHSTKQASKQMLAQVPLSILGGLLGNGVMGQVARLGLGFGVGSVFLKYSRSFEAQADDVGARIMYNAGYNPVEMANFFRKLEEDGGSRGSQFFSDHPNPGNRVAAVSKEVQSFPHKSFQSNSNSAFLRAKQQAQGIKGYTAQEIQQQAQKVQQGGQVADPTVSSVQPGTNYQTFDHSAFTVAYPDNWKAFGDRQSALTIAPESGISQNAVAYGVIISGFQPENPDNLDQATHELVASLRQSNPDLKTIGNDDDIRVNGVKGKSIDLIGKSPIQDKSGQAVQERDWLVAVPGRNGSVIYAVFISPDREFNNMRPTFEKILRSLKLK